VKTKKIVPAIMALIMIFVLAVPVSAQLGDTDVSSITIQNVSSVNATVTVTFVSESGFVYTPTQLDNLTPTAFPNPFTLVPNQSRQIYVPNVPAAQLPTGRYSVVISSTEQVVAVAGVAGMGTRRFSGSYSGFSAGASQVYLPSTAFNYFGWYSMISIQNLGSAPANVTVTITCSTGLVGTLQVSGVPEMASHTFALKNTTPTGFTGATVCNGSALVTSTNSQPIAAVDSMSKPSTGSTNTFEASAVGFQKLYVPSLSTAFFGWNSSLTIRKLVSGSTTVTIDYSDAEPNDTCNLTNATPACQLYLPTHHPSPGLYGATITSSPANQLLAVVGTTKDTLSGAYKGFGSGSGVVKVPEVTKYYFNWITSVTCQNVSSTATTLNFSYQGFPAYNHPETLTEGEAIQVFVPNEAFLPVGYQGGLTVSANAAGAEIACIVSHNNPSNLSITSGDWATYYNAFNQE